MKNVGWTPLGYFMFDRAAWNDTDTVIEANDAEAGQSTAEKKKGTTKKVPLVAGGEGN